MSIDLKYELAIAECNSLRRQLKDAYNKCTAIYEALSILDESSQNERIILEKLITNLKETIENELEKNTKLSHENLQYEQKEKHLEEELNYTTEDLKKIRMKYQRIYIHKQQEKYIENNRPFPIKKSN
jgi:hypothetical protein